MAAGHDLVALARAHGKAPGAGFPGEFMAPAGPRQRFQVVANYVVSAELRPNRDDFAPLDSDIVLERTPDIRALALGRSVRPGRGRPCCAADSRRIAQVDRVLLLLADRHFDDRIEPDGVGDGDLLPRVIGENFPVAPAPRDQAQFNHTALGAVYSSPALRLRVAEQGWNNQHTE